MNQNSIATWDVFVSYRWVEPDQTWVRTALVPQLRTAGLRVLLDVAEDGFLAGRHAICEMTRASRESLHTLCIWTSDYFSDDRMVWFESLQARLRDPQGRRSTLVPLLLRHTEIPNEFDGLIPIDWTEPARRETEWARLLKVLGAPQSNVVSPPGCSAAAQSLTASASADFHVARRQVMHELLAQLITQDPVEKYWLYIALGLTGDADARELLMSAANTETDPFARLGILDALEL